MTKNGEKKRSNQAGGVVILVISHVNSSGNQEGLHCSLAASCDFKSEVLFSVHAKEKHRVSSWETGFD